MAFLELLEDYLKPVFSYWPCAWVMRDAHGFVSRGGVYALLRLAVNPSMGARSQHPCWLRSQKGIDTPSLGHVLRLAIGRPLLMRLFGQVFGIGGSGFSMSDSRNSLNNFLAAAGGLPSFSSFLALRMSWRRVCAFSVDVCSNRLDKSWSVPSTRRSLQVSM